ncbi:MAG: 2-oxo-4-hydroxy-4-carboxy-5-ureidoimidazoline decarboxylase [Tahibacter sp.]
MNLDLLNRLSQVEFRATLADIFEHSPWVPERAWAQRPWPDIDTLHRALCDVVTAAGETAQLALIRAHPQLASKAALRGELTHASASEQSGAGLDQCSEEELRQLTELNASYADKFGFPFILAVRGRTRPAIIANLAVRLFHRRDDEFSEALRQIERIARLRLDALLKSPPTA